MLKIKIENANLLLNGITIGLGIGQVSQEDYDALAGAIAIAQGIYDDKANQTQAQLDTATTALETAITAFNNKVIAAGDSASLTTALSEARTLYQIAVEGIEAGQYVVGSKSVFNSAIETAQEVLDAASSKTDQQLAAAQEALSQARTNFENSKVIALAGLQNVTVIATATDSSNHVSLEEGETLVLTTSDNTVATVTEEPSGTIKVTGVAPGEAITITVQVKRNGQVIKTGSFTVTTIVPMSITSKELTNIDFSTEYAKQVTANSKTISTSNFQAETKSFTINDGKGNIIPVNLTWNIPQNEYAHTPAASIGSAVDAVIQDYFNANGGLGNRTVTASVNWNESSQGDTFRIQSFQSGATQSITLGGSDWEDFFGQQIYYGTDEDTSKNRTFTVSDGTKSSIILLKWNFGDMTGLVNFINQQLENAQVNIVAEKVSETNFKLISTESNGTIIIDGVDKSLFFN